MTTSKTPRPEPTGSGAPAPERDRLAGPARTTRLLAVAALVLALVALGLAAWRTFMPVSGTSDCQSRAWAVTPAEDQLPVAWATSASQYDLSRKTMSFLGPVPEDEASGQAVIYVTVTCFEEGAADAVTLSKKAAEDAGQSVIDRSDLGDQAFSAVDESGAGFMQLRRGDLVVYLAGSADTSATDMDELASAFDRALGGDGGTITPPTIAPSQDPGLESLDPGESTAAESPAAPDLIAILPTQVGSVVLAADSATGSSILGEDQGSRAILAALREAGKEADDMRVAQAYDTNAESDLSILAVTVDGMAIDQTQTLVMDTWLTATGSGVTQSTVTLDGEEWIRVDYGDGGTMDYVRSVAPNVIVITTADPALAEQAAAALP
ncbi:MAG TPA: hypothetical protein VES19_01890 [Candidatus Limnocylindrales bacterium]|nr:hypothetical protein [Candidatus Limnocylindrales bacterium]